LKPSTTRSALGADGAMIGGYVPRLPVFIAVFAFAHLNPQLANEANAAHDENGCSVPWLAEAAADFVDLFSDEDPIDVDFYSSLFQSACDKHDSCYDHGAITYGYTKSNCDSNFAADLRSICDDLVMNRTRDQCRRTGNIFHDKVSEHSSICSSDQNPHEEDFFGNRVCNFRPASHPFASCDNYERRTSLTGIRPVCREYTISGHLIGLDLTLNRKIPLPGRTFRIQLHITDYGSEILTTDVGRALYSSDLWLYGDINQCCRYYGYNENSEFFSFGKYENVFGERFEVTILEQPEGQLCAVRNGTGILRNTPITNILITCFPPNLAHDFILLLQ
jgi:hypothetical protein